MKKVNISVAGVVQQQSYDDNNYFSPEVIAQKMFCSKASDLLFRDLHIGETVAYLNDMEQNVQSQYLKKNDSKIFWPWFVIQRTQSHEIGN